jgi:hypothetical protein
VQNSCSDTATLLSYQTNLFLKVPLPYLPVHQAGLPGPLPGYLTLMGQWGGTVKSPLGASTREERQ